MDGKGLYIEHSNNKSGNGRQMDTARIEAMGAPGRAGRYRPQPLRPLEEIRADILALERETEGLLVEIVEL